MIRKSIIVVLTLAAVGTGVLWVDSYRWRPSVRGSQDPPSIPGYTGWQKSFRLNNDASARIATFSGNFLIAHADVFTPPSFRYEDRTVTVKSEVFVRHLGSFTRNVTAKGHSVSVFTLRLWLPFVALLAYPTVSVIRGPMRRWRRGQKGLCANCGYDLTDNVSCVCPGCGTELDEASCGCGR